MSDNKKNTKKICLIVILIILAILFVGYGIFLKSTPQSREKKIISYLEKKYNSEFNIIGITQSGDHVIMPSVSDCNGQTICPEIKENGAYCYRYNVLSVQDNITFEVEYIDRKLKDTITEKPTYYSIKYTDNILRDINNYIVDTIGQGETTFDSHSISIEFNENLDDIYTSDYEQKIEKISKYIQQKNSLDKDLNIIVYLYYSDDLIKLGATYTPIRMKRPKESSDGAKGQDISSGKYIKTYHLDDYFEG